MHSSLHARFLFFSALRAAKLEAHVLLSAVLQQG
jgi:hypothetical protein